MNEGSRCCPIGCRSKYQPVQPGCPGSTSSFSTQPLHGGRRASLMCWGGSRIQFAVESGLQRSRWESLCHLPLRRQNLYADCEACCRDLFPRSNLAADAFKVWSMSPPINVASWRGTWSHGAVGLPTAGCAMDCNNGELFTQVLNFKAAICDGTPTGSRLWAPYSETSAQSACSDRVRSRLLGTAEFGADPVS